jgi:ketosteroid isomerase-like protein
MALLLILGAAGCLARTEPPSACVVPPSPIDAATRAELVQARDAVWRAYYAGDTARLLRILPKRMVGMDQDRAAIIRDAQAFAAAGGRLVKLEFKCDEFFVSGDVAVVYSQYTTETEKSGKRTAHSGRAIEVFERRDGRWVNPSWHLDDAQ